MSVGRDARDAGNGEVDGVDFESCQLHERNQEPPQAAVDVNRDVVLDAQLWSRNAFVDEVSLHSRYYLVSFFFKH